MSTTATTPTGDLLAAATAEPDFAQPIYLDDPGSATGAGSTSDSSLDEVGVIFNLNDPNLLSADIEIDQEADPYAAPPPVPDGRWQVKVKRLDVKDDTGQLVPWYVRPYKNKDGSVQEMRGNDGLMHTDLYAFSALEATIVDLTGKHEGRRLSDYFVSTQRTRNHVVRILTCLMMQLPKNMTPRNLINEYVKALASEPLLEIATVWEGAPDQAEQERIEAILGKPQAKKFFQKLSDATRGQHHWPQDSKGNYIPEREVDTSQGKIRLRARPRINAYFPLGSAKASGMELGPKGR